MNLCLNSALKNHWFLNISAKWRSCWNLSASVPIYSTKFNARSPRNVKSGTMPITLLSPWHLGEECYAKAERRGFQLFKSQPSGRVHSLIMSHLPYKVFWQRQRAHAQPHKALRCSFHSHSTCQALSFHSWNFFLNSSFPYPWNVDLDICNHTLSREVRKIKNSGT